MNPQQLLTTHLSKHFCDYQSTAHLQHQLAHELADCIITHAHQRQLTVSRALEIGAGTGFLTHKLVTHFSAAQWIINDLISAAAQFAPANVEFIHGDAEHIPLGQGFDLIASSSALQWFTDISAFFHRTRTMMQPHGIFAVCLFGVGTCHELRELLGIGLPYLTQQELVENLQSAGFHILEQHATTVTLTFPSPRHVLDHLRHTGVNSITPFQFTKSSLRDFEHQYRARFALPDDTLPLTFAPIRIIATST